jgi:predicted dehydrogenase
MQTTIALVGVGGYGQYYLKELLSTPPESNIKLVAGIDPYPERSTFYESFQEYNLPIYPDLETFYQQSHADLVILAAPIHLHAPFSALALEHGSHVLCEKPLGASLADVEQMQAAERKSGRILAIGYQWSFSDTVLALKRDILAGRFGRPMSFKTLVLWSRSRAYYQRNAWAGRIRSAEGDWVLDSPVNNATAHYLHNMLFLLGSTLETSVVPTEVYAELYRANPIENYDAAALRVATEPGVDLLFLTAHPVLEVIGPLAEYSFEEAVIEFPGEDRSFQARLKDGTIISYGSPENSTYNKVWQTVEAIRSGGRVVCDTRTALPQLLCVLGAQQAPINAVPDPYVHNQVHELDNTLWVEGLADAWQAAYTANRVPAEVSSAPWMVPGTTISLAQYAPLLK